ncbi:MAG: molybdate ABC transporter substrate-binding protein [Burkholderiaceae bacterium]
MKIFFLGLSFLCWAMMSLNASAESIKVLTTGAYKQMILAMIPVFEAQTGHKVSMDNETAGELIKRVKSGEAFDVLILTPQALKSFGQEGVVESKSIVSIAKVGIGVAVKEGQELPNIKTVDDFLLALTRAKKVAYINPASGGSSGIYLDQLFKSKGWSEMISPKAFLVNGGYVASALVSGEADLAIHQISEIVPVKGARLVGPLPEELQNYTVYSGAIGSKALKPQVARDFLALVSSAQAAQLMREKGMTPMF